MEHRDVPYQSYPERERITEVTELVLAQISAARQALIEIGGPYGRAVAAGHYLSDPKSSWRVYRVCGLDNGMETVVLWNEIDDGSYSFHFAGGEATPTFYYYEN